MDIALILALGIVSYILLDLTFRLDEEHIFLKLLSIFFVFFFVMLIPKATIDPSCEMLLINTTITGNTTTYIYDSICTATTTQTATIFFESTISFIKLLFLYLFLYLLFQLVFKKMFQNKGWIK